MKSIIVCFLCLFLGQVISEDLPPLENASEVEEEDTEIFSVFSEPKPCGIEGVLGCSNDCKAILFCLNGKELVIDCLKQSGKPYCKSSKADSECTSTAVTCPEIKYNFTCPTDPGYYPHALNCAKVWQCTDKGVTLKTCGAGLVFDPLNRKCVKGIPCFTFNYVDGLCKGKEELFVTHPLNRGIYAYCDGPFPEINACPADHIFSINKLTCEYECKSIGIFKNPLEPNCYYVCTKNAAGILQRRDDCCKDGEEFDEDLSACDTPLQK